MVASTPKIYGLCAVIFLCILLGPPLASWMSSIISSNLIVLDLRDIELPALYKRALRNGDGSIDLTINIPNSAPVIKYMMDRQTQMNHTSTGGHGQKNKTVPRRKTYYPITLESPYVLNSPEVCAGLDSVHTLVIVHTATDHFQRRRLIRETWAGRHVMSTHYLRVAFMLGLTHNDTVQLMLENERAAYGDIVQGAFLDTYHNLTHKAVLGLRWILEYCPQSKMILKIDDDVFIDPFVLHRIYYPKYGKANRTIACHIRPKNTSPILRRHSKWTVQEYEFRGYKFYPFPYCNGYMAILTRDLIRELYRAAFSTPFFWVDDVYAYGMLPAKAGNVQYQSITKFMSLQTPRALNCYRAKKCQMLCTSAKTEDHSLRLWQLALAQLTEAQRKEINPAFLVT